MATDPTPEEEAEAMKMLDEIKIEEDLKAREKFDERCSAQGMTWNPETEDWTDKNGQIRSYENG